MRTIAINEEIEITIEALTRRQIEALKEKKFNVSTMYMGVTNDQWDAFVDALLVAYCGEKKAERVIDAMKDLAPDDYRSINLELIAETWSRRAEEKN